MRNPTPDRAGAVERLKELRDEAENRIETHDPHSGGAEIFACEQEVAALDLALAALAAPAEGETVKKLINTKGDVEAACRTESGPDDHLEYALRNIQAAILKREDAPCSSSEHAKAAQVALQLERRPTYREVCDQWQREAEASPTAAGARKLEGGPAPDWSRHTDITREAIDGQADTWARAREGRRACACVVPDPVMQADRKFYCYTCGFETGARPSTLEPERWYREKREAEAERDALRQSLTACEELEARLCLEDVGFEEYIGSLHRQLQAAGAERDRQAARQAETAAILEATTDAVMGLSVSDFMESFPGVRAALDLHASVRAAERDFEELEARLCPEDVGFEEYIGSLRKRLASAEAREQQVRAELRRVDAGLVSVGDAIAQAIERGYEKVNAGDIRAAVLQFRPDAALAAAPAPAGEQKGTDHDGR